MAGSGQRLKLGLGTVQFGLDYGISNTGGRVSREIARAIVHAARPAGIDLLDTAAAYGESESVLGHCEVARAGLRVVTKLPPVPEGLAAHDVGLWARRIFEQSRQRMGLESVYGVMMHRASDLLGDLGGAVWHELQAFKAEGWAQRVGASVYTGEEIDRLLERYDPGLIQLPINLLDQRLVQGGQLDRLKGRGVEVHARSLLLQGLLTMDAGQLPDYFHPLRGVLNAFEQDARAQGLSRLQGALRFGSTLPQIDCMIVGVTSVKELQEVIEAAVGPGLSDYSRYAVADEALLNPARWPRRP